MAGSSSSSEQVAVIDSKSHAVVRTLPLGVASPDWAHLYTVRSDALLDVDPQTASVSRSLLLGGPYQLPPAAIDGVPGGLSQNGDWLVVESFDGAGSALPTATHLLVISAASWKVFRRLDLTGDFQYDAISNDGGRLYLIQYLSPTEYDVRLYDLIAGQLDANIVVDKADGNQAMAGLRLSGVASPDGHWLYSLYVRQNQSPFIHALSMDGPFAFCIDLPGTGYMSPAGGSEFHWSLGMSGDGSRLYAVNGALGLVADVNPATNFQPAVKRIVHFSTGTASGGPVQGVQAKEISAEGVVVSSDGKTLVAAGGTGLVWIDAWNLQAQTRALGDWRIAGVVASPDGQAIYALADSGMIAQLSMSTAAIKDSFDWRQPGYPITLMRVAAA